MTRLILSTIVVILLAGCFGSEEKSVVYENRTLGAVRLFYDDEELGGIEPGGETSVAIRKSTLPNRVRVIDAKGTALYDHTETWEYLAEHDFRIVVE
jgi:hypothetical protein